MVWNTNPTNSVADSWVDQSKLTVQPSPPTAEAAIRDEAAAAPTSEIGNPGLSQPAPAGAFQQSPRVWRSGEPHYQLPINNGGDHWNKLSEKVDQFDKEFCAGWNSEIDALLTFAGLFSAVVTAFAVESYKLLQPDPQDMTNRILLNVSAQLAGGNATDLPSGFSPSSSSLRINTLWFLSLTFSLTAGLIGILCKQWLRHYQQDISKPPKEALAFRQFRYDALLKWRVVDILSILPVLLGLGLILFFIGLVDFLQGLNLKVSIPVTILVGLSLFTLTMTTLAPVIQYIAVLRPSDNGLYTIQRPVLFAFKSPQSLAILHLVTWLFPLSPRFKVPSWASLELEFLSDSTVLRTYTGRALIWLDETFSHSLDMVRQICQCLQDVEDGVVVENVGEDGLWDFSEWQLSTAVIKSIFDRTPTVDQTAGHTRRDVIAMRYMYSLTRPFNQHYFTTLEHSIRALNSSRGRIRSLEIFEWLFFMLSIETQGRPADHPAEQLQEVIWQRAILFRNLLSGGRWADSTQIPYEVWNVSRNLKAFTDEDLDFIFDALRRWMDEHSQDADMPSHCWVVMASGPTPRELGEALQQRPPVRDFMAFLDSRFQMGVGVKYLCHEFPSYYYNEMLDSFFAMLSAWVDGNPQDAQTFIYCQTVLTAMDSRRLAKARRSRSFHDFETFVGKQIALDE